VYVNAEPEVTVPEIVPYVADAVSDALELLSVGVSDCVPPSATVAEVGETVSVAPEVSVIATLNVRLSVASWTVTVSLEPEAGAVYVNAEPLVTVPEIVPYVADAVSDALELLSVGVSDCVPPSATVAEVGETVSVGLLPLETVTLFVMLKVPVGVVTATVIVLVPAVAGV
jgi:hypothetical protein